MNSAALRKSLFLALIMCSLEAQAQETFLAVTDTNALVRFHAGSPGSLSSPLPITGIQPSENILGIDYRPANGRLYALGDSNRLYTIDPRTGVATQVGNSTFSVSLSGSNFGFDFNPVPDRIRVVSDTGQNLRLHPDLGTVVDTDPNQAGTQIDASLAYDANDVNVGDTPGVAGAAYTNNTSGASTTTNYALDASNDFLVTQGGLNGSPSPNGGLLFSVGALTLNGVNLDTTGVLAFDIVGSNGTAYAVLRLASAAGPELYQINLATGAATLLGALGGNPNLVAATVVPAPEPLLAVTQDNLLVGFNSDAPDVLTSSVALTGLRRKETILALDVRPKNAQVYALGSSGRLYTVNRTTGVVTQIGRGPLSPTLNGTRFGFDFNPVPDRIRIVSDADQNLRVHPDLGTVVDADPNTAGTQLDATLAYDANDVGFGGNPSVVGAAYTNNGAVATSTTNYAIDTTADRLVTQGSVDGSPVSPNTGRLFTVGSLGITADDVQGFDITFNGSAYAVIALDGQETSNLYRINLRTGAATLIGALGTVRAITGFTGAPREDQFIGITASNQLVRFDAATPGTLSTPLSLTGLGNGETLVGIDVRPANGSLYGVTQQGRLYRIDPATGVATSLSASPFNPTLSGSLFGVDFNPVPDRLRVVSDTQQNLRIHPDTGAVVDADPNTAGTQPDGALAYDPNDVNAGETPRVIGAAYTNNFAGAASTTNYGIDVDQDVLVTQGSPTASPPVSPNTGRLFTIAPLTLNGLNVDVIDSLTFDVTVGGTAYAALRLNGETTSKLYQVDLTSGALRDLGLIGTTGTELIAMAGTSIASGTISISAAASGTEGSTLTVTLTRSGSAVGAAVVGYVFQDDSATNGADYAGINGSVTFANGETIKTFDVNLVEDGTPEPVETFTISLGSLSSGVKASTQNRVTVTILDDDEALIALAPGNVLQFYTTGNIATANRTVTVTGLQVSETLLGIDVRPKDGKLYGVGSTGRLYTIALTDGSATQIGTSTFSPALSGTRFGIDFNPVPDRLRVVSDTRQNLRVNPDTGAVVDADPNTTGMQIDGTLAYDANDVNAGQTPSVVGAAYANNFAGTTMTTNYAIDSARDVLVTQGSVNGTPVSPNTGRLFTVGPLGIDVGQVVGFDLSVSGIAYAALTLQSESIAKLYTIDLGTGAATLVGTLGNGSAISGLAAQSVASGSLEFRIPEYSGPEGAQITLVVDRVGGNDGILTVEYQTVSGTAIAGEDFNEETVTLTFPDKVNLQTIPIVLRDDNRTESVESFTVRLQNPSGSTVVGPRSTITINILEDDDQLLALTASNELLRFVSTVPVILLSRTPVLGLQGNDSLVGIDFRPKDGKLYGVGSEGRLYTIDTTTGQATQVGSGTFSVALSGTSFGVDFNPVPDRLRLVSNTGQNLRINPDTGAVVDADPNTAGTQADGVLGYDANDPSNGLTPAIAGAAYSNNFAGTATTTNYAIDTAQDALVTQGSENGSPVSPNSGVLFTVGELGVDVTDLVGFDISVHGLAYGMLDTVSSTNALLYQIDLSTGTTSGGNPIGPGTDIIRGLAVVGVATGVFQFSPTAVSVNESAGTAQLTITRSGPTQGIASVRFSTVGGSATPGQDYTGTDQVVTFQNGETSKNVTVPILQDDDLEPTETILAELSDASPGTAVGEEEDATIRIVSDEQRLLALTSLNQLLTINSAAPGTVISTVQVTGLQSLESLQGIDFRPSNGGLYGLGSSNRLYRIDPTTGAATQVGTGTFGVALSGTSFGFDFNPVPDRIRVVSNTGQNLRLHPDTGAVVDADPNQAGVQTDGALAYDPNDVNGAEDPSVVGAAYANNYAGTASTTNYALDSGTNVLATQGSLNSSPVSPNTGRLFTVGELESNSATLNIQDAAGFDIGVDGTAYAALLPNLQLTSRLYTLDLSTGDATDLGVLGTGLGIRDIAVQSVADGGIAFASTTYTVDETAGTASITVARTGGSRGTVTVRYATSNGTATAGDDYIAASGSLTFLNGETSKVFLISLRGDGLDEPDETVNLTLSSDQPDVLVQPTAAVLTIQDSQVPLLPAMQWAGLLALVLATLGLALRRNGQQLQLRKQRISRG